MSSSTAIPQTTPEDLEKIKRLCLFINKTDKEYRQKYKILNIKYQNALGMIIWAVSISCMVLVSFLYFKSIIPAWTCIIVNAIFASFLHELEHDLIHNLYFKGKSKRWIQNLMYSGIWLFRGNNVSPWLRAKMHINHHHTSGYDSDVEERAIGNGMKWGLARFIVTLDPLLSFFRGHIFNDAPKQFTRLKALIHTFPVAMLFETILYSWVINTVYLLITGSNLFTENIISVINFLFVVNIAPNVLRQFSLSFMSSNCHYHGDIPDNAVYQCQVFKPWYFAPLQLFCFNFGATHIIHHFFIGQTFYLREITSRKIHKFMKEEGYKFNDIKSMLHANAYNY